MNLLEWLYEKHTNESAVDTVSQLLAHTCIYPKYALAPDNIEISVDKDGYAELHFTDEFNNYGEFFKPFEKNVPIESDNVFVIGMMLYVMLTGNSPEIDDIEMLASGINSEEDVIPFLECETSSLDDVLKAMTNVNFRTRITAYDALDLLAKKYKGNACINIIENDSNICIDKINISLKSAVVEWRTESNIIVDGQCFYPVENNKPVRIYFRCKNYECDFKVTMHQPSKESHYNITCDSGRFYGVDIGRKYVSISVINNTGKIVGYADAVKIIMAIDCQGDYKYDKEAEMLKEKANAEIVEIFNSSFLSEVQNSVIDSSGNIVYVSTEKVVDGFIKYLIDILKTQFDYDKSCLITFTTSGGNTSKFWHDIILPSVRKCEISPMFISQVYASAMNYYAEKGCTKQIMLINSGASCTEIAIAENHEKLNNSNAANFAIAKCNIFTTSGGDKMTDVILNIIFEKINIEYNINMYSQENSNLSAAHYNANYHRLIETAEQFKKALTFADSASDTITLHSSNTNVETITVTILKNEYKNLMNPIITDMKEQLDKCLNTQRCHKTNLETVLLSGRAIATPALRNLVESYFRDTNCNIVRIYDVSMISRGAAVNSFLNRNADCPKNEFVTDSDIGYVSLDISRGIPTFKRIIVAGTAFADGKISFFHEIKCTEAEKRHHFGEFKLYTREKGMEHIDCTYDGNAIHYIGKIKFDIPDTLIPDVEKIKLEISIDTSKRITVKGFYLRKKNSLRSFINNLKHKNSEEEISASYLEDR